MVLIFLFVFGVFVGVGIASRWRVFVGAVGVVGAAAVLVLEFSS